MLRTRTAERQIIQINEDAKSLKSYAHYLIMKAQLSGNLFLDGHEASAEEIRTAEQCRRVCTRIARTLERCGLSDIPELLEYYDLAYRIGHETVPDRAFIRKHKQRVLEAWQSGDREIEESSVYGMLLAEAAYCPALGTSILEALKHRWIETLRKYGCFPSATTYENYMRLAYLMRENLDREFGGNSSAEKRKWYGLNKIEDISAVSSPILIAYRRFVSSLCPAVLDYETQMALDSQILRELSTRPDLTPHDREAFRMELQVYTTMMLA